MHKTILPRLLILIVFAFVVAACGSSEPAEESESPVIEGKDAVPEGQEEKQAPAFALGEEYRTGPGGYAFNLVPDYEYEEFYGIVSLKAPDADPELGPVIILIGGLNEEKKTTDQLLEDFVEGMGEDGDVSNREEVTIGGINGIIVDFEAMIEDKQALGKAAFVEVTPTQMFSLVATAPTAEMVADFPEIIEALLASVTFFEPELDELADLPPEPTEEEAVVVEEPVRELVRQWAATAEASSEYSDPDWAAHQATGEPDTLECGDLETAWASLESDTVEWLEVGYELPVYPTEVHIYESHTPTQVSLVEILDTEGNYHKVFSQVPEMEFDCPYVLVVEINDADYLAAAVRVTIDQSIIELPWDEIDAVELVGYADSSSDVASQSPESEEPEQSPEPAEPTQPPEDSGDDDQPAMTQVDATDISSWKWENLNTANGLADDNILSIAVAADGTVWAGNFNTGVSRIENGQITNFGVEDGLGFANGNAVAIEPDGTVWAGTTVGLGYYDGQSWQNYTRADGLAHDTINALLIPPDGTLWVGTFSGLSHFDGSDWTSYKKDDGLVDNSVNDLAMADDGTLWVATLGGVSSFDGQNWTSYNEDDGLAYDITTAIGVAPDGAVWVGTSSKGVSRFDGGTWSTYHQSDEFDLSYVKAIVVGIDGALWFTTEGNGIYRFDGQNWLNITKDDGLPDNYVDAAVVASDGSLWLGLRREGIAHFGP